MGRDGSGVHSADINPRIGAAHPRETAGFQRSLLGALTPSPLMSALWTPGRAGVSQGFLWQSPALPSRVLLHRSLARRLRRVPVVMVGRRFRFESRPESAQVGLLHEGWDPLAKGCAYCTKAPPTRSTPNPPPVAPHPRAVHPDKAGSATVTGPALSGRLKQQLSPSGRRTQPVSQMS